MDGARRRVARREPAASGESGEPLLIRAEAVDLLVIDHPRRGRAAAEALADDARTAGVPEAEVMAARAAAWAARELYDHRAAQRWLTRARRVATAAGLPHRLGQVWLTTSAVHLELGDLRRAARDLDRAREAFAPDEPLDLVFAEGLVAQKGCRVADAVAAYRAVMATDTGETILRFKAANNLGEVLTEAGHLDEAEETLALAADMIDDLSQAFAAVTAVNRGAVAVHRGDLATAEAHYARSRLLARAAGMPLVEFQLEEVRAMRAVALWPELVARLGVLVDQFRSPGAALLRADAQILLAEAALHTGDVDLARRTSLEARDSLARQRRPADRAAATVLAVQAALSLSGDEGARPVCRPIDQASSCDILGAAERGALRRAAQVLAARGELEWAVTAWLEVGRVESLRCQTARAVDAWRRAADLAAAGPVLVRVRGHLARALAASSPTACRGACIAGLADLDGHRASLTSSEQRARLAANGAALAELGLSTLSPGSSPRALLRWLEAGRSMGQIETSPSRSGPALTDDLTALRRLSKVDGVVASKGGEDDRERLTEIRRIEGRLRRRAWTDGRAATSARPVDVQEVIDLLGPAALVSYGVLDAELVAVTIAGGRARRHALGPVRPVRDALRSLMFAARRLSSSRTAATEAAAVTVRGAASRLDRLSMAPLIAHLEGTAADDLIVVPIPSLAGAPWGRLPSLKGRPVRVVPSARLWVDTALGGPVDCRSPAPAALIAGPGLPHAEIEVRHLAARRPAATVLTGDRATGQAAARALDMVTIAHLACHGRPRTDAPLLSALELADGAFTAYDIEQIPHPPSIAVLAACDAGLVTPPDGTLGADPLGFPAVLLQQGTRAVIAATVPVPDLDTCSFMVALHDRLLAGDTTARGLMVAAQTMDTSTPAGLASSIAFTCFGGG